MLSDERNRMTEPFFGEIQRVNAYRGIGETLIQAHTPIHQAEGGEPGRFLRVKDSEGPERLGQSVLSALDLSGNSHDPSKMQGWMIMRKSKPDVMPLWRKLVQKAAICLVERSTFSIRITPTVKLPEASSYGPLEQAAVHVPLDVAPAELGEKLIQAFELCE